MRFRKIYSKKFRDQASAIDYADKTGWEFVGRSGLFAKHYLYDGIEVVHYTDRNRDEVHDFRLKIYFDGYADLLVSRKTTLFAVYAMPKRVYRNIHRYEAVRDEISKVSEEVNSYGYIVIWQGERNFSLIKLFGKDQTEMAGGFHTCEAALEWAKSNPYLD